MMAPLGHLILISPGPLVAALIGHHHLQEAAHHGLLIEHLDSALSRAGISILGVSAILPLHEVSLNAVAKPAEQVLDDVGRRHLP